MKHLKITDVRSVPGDSGFLLDDGTTAILYDSGFAFTARAVEQNIQKALGNRSLDYIFLTHSHYDHVLGAAYLAKAYPQAKIVAGAYAARVFARPSALAMMESLDRRVAESCGAQTQPLCDLRVDIPVQDGDVLRCGDLCFRVIGLKGHTQCSVGYYLEDRRLLLGTETLGVYFGKDTYLPSCLVGYQMTLDAYEKASRLDIEQMLLPHWGVVGRESAAEYLRKGEAVTRKTAQTIRQQLRLGKDKEQILALLEQMLYQSHVAPTYPPDAFRLNTALMIDLIEKESS